MKYAIMYLIAGLACMSIRYAQLSKAEKQETTISEMVFEVLVWPVTLFLAAMGKLP